MYIYIYIHKYISIYQSTNRLLSGDSTYSWTPRTIEHHDFPIVSMAIFHGRRNRASPWMEAWESWEKPTVDSTGDNRISQSTG